MADRTRSYHDDGHGRNSRTQSPNKHRSHSHRTRSPHRSHHKRRHHAPEIAPADLPYGSRPLTKRDYSIFRPMFGLYLDIQKGKNLDDLDDVEAKGRWKSFIGKWNRGELAEGWYDPSTLKKAQQSTSTPGDSYTSNAQPKYDTTAPASRNAAANEIIEGDSDSDDSVGPALPGHESRSRGGRMGPSIPNMQDLELKREMEAEDGLARRDDIRLDRKLDRKAQKDALDELAPRAEPGTRERQLEKKKEVNDKMKSFREKSPGAAEVPDAELMGGGDGVGEYKKIKQEFERKKNERELRKEEFLRARVAEREERLSEYRTKEEGTMTMLKALAKQRFG